MKKGPRLARLFTRTQHDIDQLTDIYYASLFSRPQTEKNDAIRAFNIWKHLRLRLTIARISVILSKAKNFYTDRRNSSVAARALWKWHNIIIQSPKIKICCINETLRSTQIDMNIISIQTSIKFFLS
jgi:hypothetical protein